MILTLTQVDRGIYEALRLEAVAAGYLPDVRLYGTDEEAKEKYAHDLDLWKETTDKEAVEVWGVANYDRRTSGTVNNIIINRITRGRGDFGAGTVGYQLQALPNEAGDPLYTKYRLPEGAYDLTYQITYNTDTALMDRVINGIIGAAMGFRKYIPAFDANFELTGAGFWLYFRSEGDTSGDDYMERTLSYLVTDVFLESETIIQRNIPGLVAFKPAIDVPDVEYRGLDGEE